MVPLQSDHRSSEASSLTHGLDNSFWLHIKQTLHTHSVECLELQQTYSNYLLLILQAIFSKAGLLFIKKKSDASKCFKCMCSERFLWWWRFLNGLYLYVTTCYKYQSFLNLHSHWPCAANKQGKSPSIKTRLTVINRLNRFYHRMNKYKAHVIALFCTPCSICAPNKTWMLQSLQT